MSLANLAGLGRLFDRVVPSLLLILGLASAAAVAAVGA
jgi:hypothetical protein